MHSVGITKGEPLFSPHMRQTKRGKISESRPRWHGVCSCGWKGTDHSDPIVAQDEALSHQAGTTIRRTVVVKESDRSPVTGHPTKGRPVYRRVR